MKIASTVPCWRRAAVMVIVLMAMVAPWLPSAEAATCPRLQVWVAEGCPHCAAAERYLADLQRAEPGLEIVIADVRADLDARAAFVAWNEATGIARAGVPTFVACGRHLVGFDSAAVSGPAVRALLMPADMSGDSFAVELPLFGRVSPGRLGLPLFTIALGLVDGFNPCAMWVLLLLLSLLVNVRDRLRIALVAGTFVIVSGLVYFAFMAAWLSAFTLLGYSRALQAGVGGVAALVGTVHLKDAVAPHRGLSFSIPQGAKPGLYQRIAGIVRADRLMLALAATVLLAVVVNLIELLCTAGLPALYTQVLSQRALSPMARLAYLGLYNLAYVFDDAVVTTVAVITLGKHRLAQGEGRWLKFVSGVVLVTLGLILVIAPDLLVR